MTRLVIDGMRQRGFGRIVSISSINGRKGQMGQANYSAAKAGLLGFTKAVAQEGAARGITVNVIAPGYIATEMVQAMPKEVLETKILPFIPVGRLGTAEEIARCVAFLVADDAGFITGACLDANGGQYMAYASSGMGEGRGEGRCMRGGSSPYPPRKPSGGRGQGERRGPRASGERDQRRPQCASSITPASRARNGARAC